MLLSRLNVLFLFTLMLSLSSINYAFAAQESYEDIHQCYASSKHPGQVIQIMQDNTLVYANALGLAQSEEHTKLSLKDNLQIGSVTKQFTAAAILLLAEQGKLKLSDTLDKFLPDYPTGQYKITLKQMLNHTSGLPNYLENSETMQRAKTYAELDVVVKQLAKDEMAFAPGSQHKYSNTAYILLGKVIEIVSQQSYQAFMQKHIFAKAGLKNTYVVTSKNKQSQVIGYTRVPENPDDYFMAELVDYSWIHAAGAIASTVNDMAKWNQALVTGKVISPKSYQLMTSVTKLNDGSEVPYGLGVDVYSISGQLAISHRGGVPGFQSWSVFFPKQGVYGIILSNDETTHPGPSLLHMLAKTLGMMPKMLATKVTKEQAQRFIGSYQQGNGELQKITYANEQLFMQSGDEDKWPLILRADSALSYECSANYFKLIEHEGKPALSSHYIYQGQGPIAKKLVADN